MLRVASIGLGWWSDELAKSVHGKSKLLKLVTCYSRTPEKRSAFAEAFGTSEADSYEAVLENADVDAVILTTPHSLHAEHVLQAAKAGKHIFVEKPFTLTVASAREAVAAARSAGIVLAVGQNRRFSAIARRLKDMWTAGDFGQVLHLEANFSAPGALSYTPERWRARRSESPGGGLAALGIHMIDLLCWLAGPVERVVAFAKHQAVAVDIDDTTAALFEFAGGPTGYLGCTFASPYTSYLNIYGTKANAFAGVDGGTLEVRRNGEPARTEQLEQIDTLQSELEEFAAACKGERPFRVDLEEAIHGVAVMEAIVSSASRNGAAVEPDKG